MQTTIAKQVLKANLSFSQTKNKFGDKIEFVDGADLSHDEDCVEVIFNDDSSVIFKNESPSLRWNNFIK